MTNPLGQGPAQSYSQGQNCRRSLQTLDIYGLFLKSSGLYVLQDIAQAKFPMTLVDLKSHGIDSLIKAVKTYQEMALEIHSINGKNEQGSSGKKKKLKMIPKNKIRAYTAPNTSSIASTWIRALWKPLQMESDSEYDD